MSKFKQGDIVRCINEDTYWSTRLVDPVPDMHVMPPGIYTVDQVDNVTTGRDPEDGFISLVELPGIQNRSLNDGGVEREPYWFVCKDFELIQNNNEQSERTQGEADGGDAGHRGQVAEEEHAQPRHPAGGG